MHIQQLLTGDGETEDVAGASLVVECWSEALCRDERFDEVSHHVDLRLFFLDVFVKVFVVLRRRRLYRTPAGRGGSTGAGWVGGRGGAGGVGSSTAEVLPLAPDDGVVEQVELGGDKLTLELGRLPGVQGPRLRLGQHVNRQRYITILLLLLLLLIIIIIQTFVRRLIIMSTSKAESEVTTITINAQNLQFIHMLSETCRN